MANASSIALRVVLVLAGLIIVFTGLNTALGGMLTLGWQGQTVFFQVTDQHAYLVQDSHIRFLGGLWLGIGLFFLVASTNVRKFRSALFLAFALIFLGGLARFTQMRPEITFGPEIVGSLIAELVGMPLLPLLYFWVARSLNKSS
jgi:uncharacterized protein DUF4345